MIANTIQAIVAAAGIVMTQAHTIFLAIPQRTAFTRWNDPTPAIEPAMAWVVETGSPKKVGKKMDSAAAVSAQNPPRGLRRVIRPPMVRTMRQPPLRVPRPMAPCAEKITHTGTCKVGKYFAEYNTAATIPMVFCASLDPCAKLKAAAESNWSLRKYLSILAGVALRKSQ